MVVPVCFAAERLSTHGTLELGVGIVSHNRNADAEEKMYSEFGGRRRRSSADRSGVHGD